MEQSSEIHIVGGGVLLKRDNRASDTQGSLAVRFRVWLTNWDAIGIADYQSDTPSESNFS